MKNSEQSTINYFKQAYSAEMSPAELDYKIDMYVNNARRTFDPSKNASFTTHLSNHLGKLRRDIHSQGSSMKTSEELGFNLNKIKKAKDEFYMTHGTNATIDDLAKSTGFSKKIVKKYDAMSSIKTVNTDKFDTGSEVYDIHTLLPDIPKEDAKMADVISQGMSTKAGMEHTGLQKTQFFKKKNDFAQKLRESYLRNRMIGEEIR